LEGCKLSKNRMFPARCGGRAAVASGKGKILGQAPGHPKSHHAWAWPSADPRSNRSCRRSWTAPAPDHSRDSTADRWHR